MINNNGAWLWNTYQWKAETDGIHNLFGYCGEYTDQETGLIYLRNRYYSPTTGRFITEDPIRDGLNWYAYCENNPIMFVDHWGLAPGDHFSTRDEAAADFGIYIGQKSIDIEEELASCIYKGVDENNTDYFFYDEPRNELETHEERNINFYISWDPHCTPVALVHTHGAYDANTYNEKDIFSTPDNVLSKNPDDADTLWSDNLNIDYYLVTPNGKLKLYTANSGDYAGSLIRSDLILDSRIKLHHYWERTLLWDLLKANFSKGEPYDYINVMRNNPDSVLDAITELEKFRRLE